MVIFLQTQMFPKLTVAGGGPQFLTVNIFICHNDMMATYVTEDITNRNQCLMHTINSNNHQNLE